jgi:hypothetical protein
VNTWTATPFPIVLTNRRRKYLPGLMLSLAENTNLGPGVILDDSGDEAFLAELKQEYPEWRVRPVRLGHRAGYNAAMQEVWKLAALVDHVVFLEEDFRFEHEVLFQHLASALDSTPRLAQIALLRQPWFPNEIEAGGLIPALEDQGHTFRSAGNMYGVWLEQRAYFTMNPCIFRGRDWVKNHPWPTGDGSEYAFSRALFDSEPGTVCAYWGSGEIWVTHVGEREGFGY